MSDIKLTIFAVIHDAQSNLGFHEIGLMKVGVPGNLSQQTSNSPFASARIGHYGVKCLQCVRQFFCFRLFSVAIGSKKGIYCKQSFDVFLLIWSSRGFAMILYHKCEILHKVMWYFVWTVFAGETKVLMFLVHSSLETTASICIWHVSDL